MTENMKKLIKITSIILIQTFLVMDFIWAGGSEVLRNSQNTQSSTLAPEVNISTSHFQGVYSAFYTDHLKINKVVGADYLTADPKTNSNAGLEEDLWKRGEVGKDTEELSTFERVQGFAMIASLLLAGLCAFIVSPDRTPLEPGPQYYEVLGRSIHEVKELTPEETKRLLAKAKKINHIKWQINWDLSEEEQRLKTLIEKIDNKDVLVFRRLRAILSMFSAIFVLAVPIVFIVAIQKARASFRKKEEVNLSKKKSNKKKPKNSIAFRIHNIFAKPYRKIVDVLNFVIRGKDAKKRIGIASLMITVNGFVDVYFTLPLKVAILGASFLSGNPWLVVLVTFSTFAIGGLVRLAYYPVFKIVWPDVLKIEKSGFIMNFMPWGPGNLAPILFVSPKKKPQEVMFAMEVRDVSKLVTDSLEPHPDVPPEQIEAVKKHTVEIAEAVCSYQNKLHVYNYNRFKICGTKKYAKEKIKHNLLREDFSDRFPFRFKLKRWTLARIGIKSAGYRKGTRPVLLFGTQQRLKEIKEYLKDAQEKGEIPKGFLKRVYQFDITSFNKATEQNDITSIHQLFIEQMFTPLEIAHSVKDKSLTGFLDSELPDEDLDKQTTDRFHIVAGSSNSFYTQAHEDKRFFEKIEDGSEIHIIAPGGGGDTLGAVFLILQLKQILKEQGKHNLRFKIICSNIKYGKENPFAGNLSLEYIKGLEPIDIEGIAKAHFYRIKGKLKAEIPLKDINAEQIVINNTPLFYESEWGEGEILELLKEDGIELIMMDFSQKAFELKQQYEQMIKGRKVVSLLCDLGGDLLAQIPGKLRSSDQLEVNVASPVSDINGLAIFDAPVVVMGLGGDGELREAIPVYLRQYFEQGQVAGIVDNLQFLNKHRHILNRLRKYKRLIRSEVSKNLLDRLETAVLESWDSLIEKIGHWNYNQLLEKDVRLNEECLRYESRREFLPGYYLSTLIIRNTADIRAKIKDKQVLRQDFNWLERAEYLRSLNYATEGSTYIIYRSQIKHISHYLFKLLEHNDCCIDDLIDLFFNLNTPVTIKLAVVRAIYMFVNFTETNEKLHREIGAELVRLMVRKDLDVFFISEVAKTLGIVGYAEAFDLLTDFLENPKDYGTWNFYPGYFYDYAKMRLKTAAERSIWSMIEKVMKTKGWSLAWELFERAACDHEAFEELKKQIVRKRFKDLVLDQDTEAEETPPGILDFENDCPDFWLGTANQNLINQAV